MKKRRLPWESYGDLWHRGFTFSVYCDPCKQVRSIDRYEHRDIADLEVGTIDFECQGCRRIGHYKLEGPYRTEKRLLHEQASNCRGPADDEGTPFVGPFPMLTELGNSVGDFAAKGYKLLVCCPGGRERLIDPRCVEWHPLHPIDFFRLRLRCEGCRQRASVAVAPGWYRRRGFKIVRTNDTR